MSYNNNNNSNNNNNNVLLYLVNIANCAPLFAMELNVWEEISSRATSCQTNVSLKYHIER